MTKHEKEILCRRIPKFVLVAAVIVPLLAGTALAVSVPHIQDWSQQYWEAPTADLTQGGTYQLHLEDLMMDREIVQKVQWDISFTLDVAAPLPTVDLEHVLLPVSGLDGGDFEAVHGLRILSAAPRYQVGPTLLYSDNRQKYSETARNLPSKTARATQS